MDKESLYEKMAIRKDKSQDYEPYHGGNGRIDKCVNLMRSGKIRTGGTLIDVGGAIGNLGYAVRDLYDKRLVLDIAEASKAAAESKGNIVHVADVDEEGLPYRDESFATTVAALDFIEHIIDPENFARECYRVLKSRGQVFINTPNIRFWKHIEELWMTGRFPHTSGDREVYHGGHLAFYTFNDLKEIFVSSGFTGFEQIKDEEGYAQPPGRWMADLKPKNQQEFVDLSLQLGCPNLLFLCEKP